MDVLLSVLRAVYRGAVWLANSPRTLLLAYLLLITICGGLYSHFESESIGDSLWWAVVTASTVGYGDISPQSWPARMLAALLISIMVLLVIPLITAHFASKLIVDHDAFRHEEQEELKTNLRHVRALLEEMAAHQNTTTPPGAPTPPSSTTTAATAPASLGSATAAADGVSAAPTASDQPRLS